jgi:hypothetical protein
MASGSCLTCCRTTVRKFSLPTRDFSLL